MIKKINYKKDKRRNVKERKNWYKEEKNQKEKEMSNNFWNLECTMTTSTGPSKIWKL
jgi:hypothetical protein